MMAWPARDAEQQPWEQLSELAADALETDLRRIIPANREQVADRLCRPWTRWDPDRVLEATRKVRPLLATRKSRTEIQVRRRFLYRDSQHEPAPPGCALPAGAVPVYVGLLWLGSGEGRSHEDPAVRLDPNWRARPADTKDVPIVDPRYGPLLSEADPHTLRLDTDRFGSVLGLGPSKRARREAVRRRLVELEKAHLIRRDRTPGPGGRLQLLDDRGTGDAYAKAYKDEDPWYFTVPATVFTNGWAAALSARAFLTYLAVLYLEGRRSTHRRLGPGFRSEWMPISDEQFYAGRGELAFWGLVDIQPGGGIRRGELRPFTSTFVTKNSTLVQPHEVLEHIIKPAGLAP